MVKFPEGVDINYLIDDLRILSWEAADILLKYSQILKKTDNKTNIIKNNNEKDPVTVADLEVNDLIIRGITPNKKVKLIFYKKTILRFKD